MGELPRLYRSMSESSSSSYGLNDSLFLLESVDDFATILASFISVERRQELALPLSDGKL